MYDGRIGRWTTVDPNRQFWSPYLGMGNNPIIGFDLDGAWLFFGNRKSAEIATKNVNAIFSDKFGLDNAVSVAEIDVEVTYYKTFIHEWFGIKSTKVETRYYIEPNGEWDISDLGAEDQFIANSFLDVLNSRTHIRGAIVDPNFPASGPYTVGQIYGVTKSPHLFLIPSDLPDYDPNRTNFNIGSQILHEVLWHISPAGQTLLNSGRNSNWLYGRIGGRSGNSHEMKLNLINQSLPKRTGNF
ncbi:hypothetical protein AAG747_25295 [Rapidithrix thailandica]|uniref:RHS repeat-associated core domain-containing protein n=1 Tax=Rapidithrix thailandica TaxID=413964 RepID=A0AAW9SBF9_9BACT